MNNEKKKNSEWKGGGGLLIERVKGLWEKRRDFPEERLKNTGEGGRRRNWTSTSWFGFFVVFSFAKTQNLRKRLKTKLVGSFRTYFFKFVYLKEKINKKKTARSVRSPSPPDTIKEDGERTIIDSDVIWLWNEKTL